MGMVKSLNEMINDELAKTNDVERLKKLVIDLAELADKKGATEAEIKEHFQTELPHA